ncbi:MAG: starch-binding protein [Ruminococcus sp.]|nr:starch-binding protein [Ruminococcus sp.]
MKKTGKLLSLLLAVLMLASVMLAGATGASAALAEITYEFANTTAGYAQGTVTLTPSADNQGTYTLYWADDSAVLPGIRELATLDASSPVTFEMPEYTAIPADATKLVAFKAEHTEAELNVANADAVFELPASKQLDFSSADVLYTFGSISDPQLANDSHGSNSYPYDEEHLKAAFETLYKRDVDFTVLSGDVVNDQNGNQTYAAEYEAYLQILADSHYTKPIYEANGNHDVGTKWNKNGDYYNDNTPFIIATGLDSNLETIKKGLPYFEITEPTTGDHFIFMALEGGFYTNKGTQFSTAQLDWLESLLKKYHGDGKNIFIIEHANITAWGSGDKLTKPYYYDLALEKSNPDVTRFVELMETYKECVIITGHTHLELSAQYNYSDNAGTSAVMMHNSAIGGVRRLIDGKVDRTAVKGLSEGYIVEVYEDCILFNGINMYYNEIMPQCSYIIPMGTSLSEPSTEPDTTPATENTEPTETTTQAPTETTAEPSEPASTQASTPEDNYLYGDTDLSGTVNVKDATAVQKHTASLINLEGDALVQADVNADGTVNVKDATAIQKYVAGLLVTFPAEKSTDTAQVNVPPQELEDVMKLLDDCYMLSSYNQYQALKDEFFLRQDYDALKAYGEELAKLAGEIRNLKPQTREINIYFSNNRNWSDVYAYVWGEGGSAPASWPGTKMTKAGTNSMGEDIYTIKVDCSKYQNIIFTNNSEQSKDTVIVQKDNTGYYLNDDMTCGTYDYKG